jgi:hypothetical protein
MKITDYKDGKLMALSKPMDNRVKILNLFYFILFFTTGGWWILKATYPGTSIGALLFFLLVGVVFLVVSYRFANKMMMTEELFVNKDALCLIKRGISPLSRHCFDLAGVSQFRHLEKPEDPKHPLAGENYDYFGFQTEQKLIRETYGDDRLAFDYGGKTITFGDNVYSWDFDEIAGILEHFGYGGES